MNLKEKLKRLFFNRAPNALTFDHIKFEFPEEKPETLKDTLNELEEEKFLGIQENRIPRLPDLQREEYFILEERIIEKYPMETEINVGGMKIPRFIDGDRARAEDINLIARSLNKMVDEKVKKVEETYNKELKKYWGTIITLFGLFITIFSLVNIAIKPIYYKDLDLSSKEIFIQSFYNIAPLILVLMIFLGILYLLMRNKKT